MRKIDLRKELRNLYNPSAKEITIVEVPKKSFIMVDGMGDPNTSRDYSSSIETLYSLSYTIKFIFKKEKEIDYPVMPLEGLWWMEDMSKFNMENKDSWLWTSMIMQPDFVSREIYERAYEHVKIKKNLPALSKVRFEVFDEGLASQIMHIGPYAAEASTIEKLHKFIKDHGYKMRGKHHEIYLSDSRKSSPEKMKTVIRQPISAVVL
jgi:hypothetical protein